MRIFTSFEFFFLIQRDVLFINDISNTAESGSIHLVLSVILKNEINNWNLKLYIFCFTISYIAVVVHSTPFPSGLFPT